MSKSVRPVGIIGIGSAVPERVLTNHDLEQMMDTSDEWITSRTGIRERRIASDDIATSDLGLLAAKRAIADAGIDAEELDCIIVATVSPDMPFPATACIIQAGLGANRIPSFDISAGCSGFVYALSIAKQFISAGTYDKILIVGAEVLSRVVNWQDRSTCVLFGDGAGAAVVAATDEEGVIAVQIGADGKGAQSLCIPGGGSRLRLTEENIAEGKQYLHMSGNEVFKFAVRIMAEAAASVVETAGLQKSDIDIFIPHQANTRIIDAAAQRLELPSEKVFINVDKYGNTSAASIPIAIDEAYRAGLLSKGKNIVLVGFGAGLTWGSAVIKWLK